MKIDATGSEASSIPTNWPAAVTYPRCAQIDDQRSGRWHTTDGARGKAAMAFFSENLHGHPQSEGCDDLCDIVTQVVATSGRTILVYTHPQMNSLPARRKTLRLGSATGHASLLFF